MNWRLAINFVAFQVGWLSCVLGAAKGLPWLGLAVTSVVVALHLHWAERPAAEARLVSYALLMGVVLDGSLVASELLRYQAGLLPWPLPPYWILALWALFATTPNVSMRWLHGRYLLAVLFGALGGPLSYWAGARLGAVELVSPAFAFVALAMAWAIAMPVLMAIAARLDLAARNRTSGQDRARVAAA